MSVKMFIIRIETTHHMEDEATRWEETVHALKRAARENFFEPEVTVDELAMK